MGPGRLLSGFLDPGDAGTAQQCSPASGNTDLHLAGKMDKLGIRDKITQATLDKYDLAAAAGLWGLGLLVT